MNNKLIILIALISYCRGWTKCRSLFCPPHALELKCDECNRCLDQNSRYCYSGDDENCSCATSPSGECVETPAQGLVNHTFCHLLDDMKVDKPELAQIDNDTVTIVVPRFFEQPPFDVHRPSFLFLLVLYDLNGAKCRKIGDIQAFSRNDDKCLLRVRLKMPSIDYTGHENYYYDDRSQLETQFGRHLFANATFIRFWLEVTIRQQEKIKSGEISFVSVLRSKKIQAEL